MLELKWSNSARPQAGTLPAEAVHTSMSGNELLRKRTPPIARPFVPVAANCAIWALAGCATTVIPPERSADLAEVYVVDHGKTSSLIIPASGGGMLRYAYGDWNYYALGRRELRYGIAALFWPTHSGLGRAELRGVAGEPTVRAQAFSIESVHPVPVGLARVREFEQRMEALYSERRDTEVENPVTGLSFVHHPRDYTYLWNSNHAVASWLRELGCKTQGPSFRASWRVRAQQ
jgi:hypothetical protein